MINIYSKTDIEYLAESGKILSGVLHHLAGLVRPGISTYDLDHLAEKMIRDQKAVPAFLGYHERGMKPYPASLCTSINDELVHCLPYKSRVLKEGDITSLDLGVNYKGYFTDMALTVPVGKVSETADRLMASTRESLEAVLQIIRPGIRIGDIGAIVQSFADRDRFSVVRDLVGHGVGKSVHEDPKVPNYGIAGTGEKLKVGMVLAIEPMFAEKSYKIKMLPDGWGIATLDGGLSAHFEKTVAITEHGGLILTP